mmetsp:Transcript_10950/g.25786  ORF Transcript_10950/g.25786 Transcript_10950/m.25786 type:complete len:235 (-) Transcript_10950:423-1127(-)
MGHQVLAGTGVFLGDNSRLADERTCHPQNTPDKQSSSVPLQQRRRRDIGPQSQRCGVHGCRRLRRRLQPLLDQPQNSETADRARRPEGGRRPREPPSNLPRQQGVRTGGVRLSGRELHHSPPRACLPPRRRPLPLPPHRLPRHPLARHPGGAHRGSAARRCACSLPLQQGRHGVAAAGVVQARPENHRPDARVAGGVARRHGREAPHGVCGRQYRRPTRLGHTEGPPRMQIRHR